jgi:hypothetical protein
MGYEVFVQQSVLLALIEPLRASSFSPKLLLLLLLLLHLLFDAAHNRFRCRLQPKIQRSYI